MTVSVPSEAIERRWHVVDAGGKVLGRLASQIAHVLRGKHKPVYSPHVDAGDFVIVINAASVRLTGRKLEGKVYYRHTGYPGSVRETTAGEMLQKHPERVIEKAVRGMLPKNALGRRMLRKLKVYSDADHPHTAQKPEALEIRV
jgi:large subunit ribosomal protein L13